MKVFKKATCCPRATIAFLAHRKRIMADPALLKAHEEKYLTEQARQKKGGAA